MVRAWRLTIPYNHKVCLLLVYTYALALAAIVSPFCLPCMGAGFLIHLNKKGVPPRLDTPYRAAGGTGGGLTIGRSGSTLPCRGLKWWIHAMRIV